MQVAFEIVAILVSLLLIIMILLQVKGGGLGEMLGGDSGSGIARSRRGLEKTLFQLTIGLAVAFLAVAILAVAFAG